MAGPATFRLWVAFGQKIFDDTALASDVNWTEVTDDCRFARFSTSTRRSQFDAFSAGTAEFRLDNRTRVYDPSYSSGTHFGDFKRNTPVRVTAEHSSTRYEVWRGAVRRFDPFYEGSFDSFTTLRCEDMLGVISDYELAELSSASYAADTTGTRIGRVLDAMGHPSAYRSLGNGGDTTTHTSTTWGTNALAHIVAVGLADGGFVYADRDGTITHDSRNAGGGVSRQVTSQVTLSHTSEPTYLSSEWQGVGDDYRDLVRVSGATGNVQTVDNSTVDDAPVVFQRLNTTMQFDGEAAATAEFYADLYQTDRMYPRKVKVRIATNGTDLRTELLPRRVRDRMTVTHDPPGAGSNLTAEVFLDGINHTVDPTQGDWTAEYMFSSADQYDGLDGPPDEWLILNDATRGVLNTYRLGY